MMFRKPSRETAIIHSDPALHPIAASAAPRPKRRAAMYVAMTPSTPTAAAAPRSVRTVDPKNRNTPATMYAYSASRPPSLLKKTGWYPGIVSRFWALTPSAASSG